MNNLDSIKAIKAGIYFDEGKIPSKDLEDTDRRKGVGHKVNDLQERYISILKNNSYNMFAWDGIFDSPSGEDNYSFYTEVYFGPEYILDHLAFEKELLNKGHDVRFERFGKGFEKNE